MEKRVSQASHKICKSDRKQVDSLLKALRPKVYITDSLNFKRLVQELTGNCDKVTSPPLTKQVHVEEVPVIDIEDHGEPEVPVIDIKDHDEPELSVDLPEFWFQNLPTLSPLHVFTALQTSWVSRQTEMLQCQEIESWPTEINPFAFYDGYTLQCEQELCISDYDLSELCNSL